MTQQDQPGERIAKVMARAGVASRRDAERMIVEGRVAVNGKAVTSPALDVLPTDRVTLDGKPIDAPQPARMWLYYKPLGLVTSEKDEKGRQTVFDTLPEGMPRVMSIGRLDLNSEGLLLLTNDGGLKRRLELPSTGWLRKYRVRVNGRPNDATFDPLRRGVVIEGEEFLPMDISLDRQQGANAWLTVGLREGKNREIRRAMAEVGLTVNRLIRVSYGPFRLNTMKPGDVIEVKQKVLKEQLGEGTRDRDDRPARSGADRPARAPRREGTGSFDRKPRAEGAGFERRPRAEGAGGHDRKPRPPRAEGEGFDRKPRAPRAEGAGHDRKPRAEGAGGGDRKPRAGGPAGYDRKPRPPRAEGEGFDRKPRAPRAEGAGHDRKPRAEGMGGYDRKPRAESPGGYDRKPRPPRAEGEGFDPKPRAPRGEGASYDRRPRAEGAGGHDRKPRPPRAEGAGFDRKPRAPRAEGAGYDRKPRAEGAGGGDRKPRPGGFGGKKPGGGRPGEDRPRGPKGPPKGKGPRRPDRG